MAKERPYVKERNKTNMIDVDFIYVLQTIAWTSKKSIGNDDPDIMLKIIEETAKKGVKGLHVEDTQKIIKKLNIPEHKYYTLLRKMKQCGLIRKTKGRFYLIYELADHYSDKSAAITRRYNRLGVKR
jgi:transcriptional regulator TrmB